MAGPMYAYIFKTTQRIFMRVILIDRVTQEKDFCVYNLHNIVDNNLSHLLICNP
jgi:hypothetical protein